MWRFGPITNARDSAGPVRIKLGLSSTRHPSRMTYIRSLLLAIPLSFAALQAAPASPFFDLATTGPLQPEQAFQYDLHADATGGLHIRWQVADGYYLYRDRFAARDLGGQPLALQSPSGVMHDDLNFGTTEIYPQDVTISLGEAPSSFILEWQGCQDDGICYAPQQARITAPLAQDHARAPLTTTTTSTMTTPAASHPAAPDTNLVPAPEFTEVQTVAAGTAANDVETLRQQGGVLWVLLGFMGLGLLLAFTPCTFPMLPILWAVLKGGDSGRARSVSLGASYVAGMALGFAMIGALAGWTGASLQFTLQTPVFLVAGAAVFLLLAAASLDLIPLRLPAALAGRITGRVTGQARGGSVLGAAAMGLGSVLLIGPCVTAPLAGALIYIAQSGDIALGAAALAMLGIGQGLPLMALALFGRGILPKSGAWLEASRVISAAIMAAVAIWLLSRILPAGGGPALWGLLALALAAAASGAGFWPRFGSRIAFAIGLIQLLGAALGAQDPLRPLEALHPAALRPAATANSLRVSSPAAYQTALDQAPRGAMVVYVTADWCITCRKLDREVFAQAEVAAALDKITFIKADVTDFNGDGGALARMLGVVGPPTTLFFDPQKQEITQLRLTGDFGPAALLERIGTLSHD